MSLYWPLITVTPIRLKPLSSPHAWSSVTAPPPDLPKSLHAAQHVKINPPRAQIASLPFLPRSLIIAYSAKSSQSPSLAFATFFCTLAAANFCRPCPHSPKTTTGPSCRAAFNEALSSVNGRCQLPGRERGRGGGSSVSTNHSSPFH